MALTIDGSGATAIASGTSSVAATITTPSTNDIIIAFIHCESTSVARTVSGVSGGGLTWALRKRWTNPSGPWSNIESWWAAAASPLTAQTITATFSGAIDDCSLQLAAVHGVLNLVGPWDVNVSLPVAAAGISGNISVSISTTATDTILFGFTGDATPNVPATGTGFTQLYLTSNGGGANYSYTKSQYQVFAVAQTGYSATFGLVQSSGAYMFDALAAVALASFVDLVGNLGGVSSYG